MRYLVDCQRGVVSTTPAAVGDDTATVRDAQAMAQDVGGEKGSAARATVGADVTRLATVTQTQTGAGIASPKGSVMTTRRTRGATRAQGQQDGLLQSDAHVMVETTSATALDHGQGVSGRGNRSVRLSEPVDARGRLDRMHAAELTGGGFDLSTLSGDSFDGIGIHQALLTGELSSALFSRLTSSLEEVDADEDISEFVAAD